MDQDTNRIAGLNGDGVPYTDESARVTPEAVAEKGPPSMRDGIAGLISATIIVVVCAVLIGAGAGLVVASYRATLRFFGG